MKRVNTDVIEAGPEFEVVGVNPLNEFTMARQAIARCSLLISYEVEAVSDHRVELDRRCIIEPLSQ